MTRERLFYFMLRAFNEQILYRLFLMSFLVIGVSACSGAATAAGRRMAPTGSP